MKKQIVITLILILVVALITIVYFKNLNPPGTSTEKVMLTIPDDAALIFDFNNEKSFYDIYNNNKVAAATLGKTNLQQLDTLRQALFQNKTLQPFFSGQNVFISFHPLNGVVEWLLTTSAAPGLNDGVLNNLDQPNGDLKTVRYNAGSKPAYDIFIKALNKHFFVTNTHGNIFSGSFSKTLTEHTALYTPAKDKRAFVLLPELQTANSLGNLYVNYSELTPLFNQYFRDKNSALFKSIRSLPAFAALSLNYKSDALMFNGSTLIDKSKAANYLSLFLRQRPSSNHLKNIFPFATAYSLNLAISNPGEFENDLAEWYVKAGLKAEKTSLFAKVKKETGINFLKEFTNSLSDEFAIVTTRYQENIAIIALKNGMKARPFIFDISRTVNDNIGQFNYDKIPFFVLGDAFREFKRPYFMIIDNYLILANSSTELTSYYNSYINQQFLSKTERYNEFDNLLAARCNVSFFINFKNAKPLLKQELLNTAYQDLENRKPGWTDFYAAAYQLTATDKSFYTNFSMQLSRDTLPPKRLK